MRSADAARIALAAVALIATGAGAADPQYGKVETFEPGKKYTCVPTPDHKGWDCHVLGKDAATASPERNPPGAGMTAAPAAPAAPAMAATPPATAEPPAAPAVAVEPAASPPTVPAETRRERIRAGELPAYLRAPGAARGPENPAPARVAPVANAAAPAAALLPVTTPATDRKSTASAATAAPEAALHDETAQKSADAAPLAEASGAPALPRAASAQAVPAATTAEVAPAAPASATDAPRRSETAAAADHGGQSPQPSRAVATTASSGDQPAPIAAAKPAAKQSAESDGAQPALVVEPPPTPGPSAGVRSAEPAANRDFRTLPASGFVIELAHGASRSDYATLRDALHPARGQLYELRLLRDGADWWLLLWGSFDSIDSARNARAELPPDAAISAGWPRRIGPLQAEALRTGD